MKSCSTLFFLVVTLFAAEQVWAEPALPICSYFLPTTDEKLPRQIKDVSSEAQKNMQNYCTTFGAILQSEQRPNQPHFFCQKQAAVLCWFDIDV
ncbi:MAG: hypothetical protein KDK51_10420, partial [Deltaproteobacteria bacterium]|nr:hypothetical protein [Deltaproteobacteria bacterium]